MMTFQSCKSNKTSIKSRTSGTLDICYQEFLKQREVLPLIRCRIYASHIARIPAVPSDDNATTTLCQVVESALWKDLNKQVAVSAKRLFGRWTERNTLE
jgi:hypothetical protein